MNHCKNCGYEFEGNYCSNCGQKFYTDKDKNIGVLIREAFSYFTSLDKGLLITLITIYRKPGKLSLDYVNGIRGKYFKPVSLYLLIVVLYMIFPIFKGLNMEMQQYENMHFSGHFIGSQIEKKAIDQHRSLKDLAQEFGVVSDKTSRILLLLLIPLSALISRLLFFKKGKNAFEHLILNTELNIFYLLTFFIVIPMVLMFLLKNIGIYGELDDDIIGISLTGIFVLYAASVFHRFFNCKWTSGILKGLLYAFIHGFVIMTIYKIIVFEITFMFI